MNEQTAADIAAMVDAEVARAELRGYQAAIDALRGPDGLGDDFWRFIETHPLGEDPSSMNALAADYLASRKDTQGE